MDDFDGAKAAVFIGEQMLVYKRDDHVVWPGHWDFPGGGGEGNEAPFDCLAREVKEEFGLRVSLSDVVWDAIVPAVKDPQRRAWFFVLRLPARRAAHIRFGPEGQQWALMSLADVAQLPNLAPGLAARLKLWLQASGSDPI